MKISDSQKKKIKIVVVVVIIALILWFMVISPILKFKKNEKILENAAKRYYEINTGQLPTGKKVKTVELQTLYDKNFISDDLRSSYTKKVCDIRNSWVKVKKENNDYKYYTYLKCGVFSSKVDHEGPVIRLKGDDLITINKGEKFKDPGIDSVSDDTDGKMDVKDVVIDSKKLNVNKIGTYEITYKIKDSFNNETVKIRTVKVTETLNHIVKKDTKGKNVYQGVQYNNYVKVDGILFRIVGINNDGSVKLVSSENLASVNYDGVDSWLNDYFYEKLSDSAKKLIVKQKFCNEEVSDPDNYTKCNKYSKKKYVGLLSVADINNSKGENGNYNANSFITNWTSNSVSNKKSWLMAYYNMAEGGYKQYKDMNNTEIYGVAPSVNLVKNSVILKGNGSIDNPYIFSKNNIKIKKGDKVSSLPTGTYIKYSGYVWRVINSEDDGTTKVVLQGILTSSNYGEFYINYDKKINYYNPTNKQNIGYKIINDGTKYIKMNYFVKKQIQVNNYKNDVGYGDSDNSKKYNVKLSEVSLFDLYSANTSNAGSFWYQEVSKNKKQVYLNSMSVGVTKEDFDSDEKYGSKVVGYLHKDTIVKSGDGNSLSPYTIVK